MNQFVEKPISAGYAAFLNSRPYTRSGYTSGEYPDVRLCSCGADWKECEFWSRFYHLSGLVSDAPVADKYKEFLEDLRKDGDKQVYIDSSKTVGPLQGLRTNQYGAGFTEDTFSILFCIKDVRSFVSSISKKHGNISFLRMLKTYNWWNGQNRKILEYLQRSDINFHAVLYERLCFDTKRVLEDINRNLGLEKMHSFFDVAHNQSHIAMGNKDFISRNRSAISYDYSWFMSDRVSVAYLLHAAARRFNKAIYDL